MLLLLCVDDVEMLAEDVVSVYAEPRSEVGDSADGVDSDEGSPSKKRRRQCLSECDVNCGRLMNASDNETVVAGDDISTCPASVATEADNTISLVSTSPRKHVNKENYSVMPSDNDTASPAVGDDDALKLQSHTFKSPPQRRNVFAQNKGSSITRQRFNVNATKDKLTSPEPVVEVRSR